MYTPDYSISTPENVDLHLELAGIGNRILAYLIDLSIIGLVLFAITMLDMGIFLFATFMHMPIDTRNLLMGVLAAIWVFVSFFLMFGYHILFEGIWQGQTPGKRVAGIRVIFSNGQPVNWGSVLLRNFIRFLDNGLMLIGLLSMLVTKDEKRLGDLAAGTLVIRERKSELGKDDLVMLTNAKAEPLLDIGRLSNDDYDLLVRFLKRRKGLADTHRPAISKKLVEFFQSKFEDHMTDDTDLAKATPEQYLETVYLTYQARAEEEYS